MTYLRLKHWDHPEQAIDFPRLELSRGRRLTALDLKEAGKQALLHKLPAGNLTLYLHSHDPKRRTALDYAVLT